MLRHNLSEQEEYLMFFFGSWQRNIWSDCGRQQLSIRDIMNILYIVGD